MNLYNTLSLPLLLLHLHIPYSTSTSLNPDPRFQTKSNRCHRLAFFASSSSSSCHAPRFDTFTDNILSWEECNHNNPNPPAGSSRSRRGRRGRVVVPYRESKKYPYCYHHHFSITTMMKMTMTMTNTPTQISQPGGRWVRVLRLWIIRLFTK